MLAKQKWQVRTIQALELVFAEREAQHAKHGDAMRHLPDGVGPDVPWLDPVIDVALGAGPMPATEIEETLRAAYEGASTHGRLTRRHLVLEELAEAFQEEGNSQEFLAELIQTAALLVQWAEYKLESADL